MISIGLVRRLNSLFKRSITLVVRREIHSSSGKSKKVRQLSREFCKHFTAEGTSLFQRSVNWLENSLDSCLTFFDFPEEEWISLRTTNVIERLNKEFKRRTKPMEIVAGENACYTLLAFISIKMEMYWRSNPVGKCTRSPSLRNLIEGNFTQSP